ncbi:OmpH family outer membrane protein, partial [bacterium]|nr:OmpH family outer membrane protein [bacterium]
MKRAILSIIIMGLLCGLASAKDAKIGIIVSARILEEYPEAQDAQKILSDEIREWERQAQQMQNGLAEMEDELSQQAMMFYSEEKKAQKQEAYQQKFMEFRKFQASIEEKAFQRNQELFQPINQKIQKIIDKISTDEGY